MIYRVLLSGMAVLNLVFGTTVSSFAQAVSLSGKVTCVLINKEEVQLFPAQDKPLGFYYLPNNLRLSTTERLQPEFLFMSWKSEASAETDNGVMHWLLTWGLSKEQEKEVQKCLIAKVDSNAIVMGALTVEAPEKFLLSGKNKDLIALLQGSLSSGAGIPTQPGGKSASSFRFLGEDARKVEQTLSSLDKWDGIFIEMPFYWTDGHPAHTLRLAAKTIMQSGTKCSECVIIPK